ncbi:MULTISPECIES: hypothetical protein [Streptomyces]|uniref:Uncharacterized protein n=1 Tax=Streptomyces edwardsiae TaxID=3075527 RepID=A0ABU2QPK9_9ACTN|nr:MULTISPECIES: hypothetical protein [unclassified Streptomyces]MDT0406403.1 hypothetical protein [Streptomyces sp. DSM 41635]
MTVPEENRPKTRDTDRVVGRHDGNEARARGGTGRTLREALEEVEIKPDDFEERRTESDR